MANNETIAGPKIESWELHMMITLALKEPSAHAI